MTRVLERYDAAAIRRLFEDVGMLRVLEQKGFTAFDVRLDTAGRVLPHVLLSGSKNGLRCLLLDACVGATVIRPEYFARRDYVMERPLDFAVLHWVREQDPTAQFRADRPRLPLQRHPGLGMLRQAFHVVLQMASELGMDGVASVPKFFHDAVIFERSRLFLFLDGAEQGRFEALVRDLQPLSLGDASIALAGGCVRDAGGQVVSWAPSYLVFPINPIVTAYFHSAGYAARVAETSQKCRVTCDATALQHAREAIVEAHQV